MFWFLKKRKRIQTKLRAISLAMAIDGTIQEEEIDKASEIIVQEDIPEKYMTDIKKEAFEMKNNSVLVYKRTIELIAELIQMKKEERLEVMGIIEKIIKSDNINHRREMKLLEDITMQLEEENMNNKNKNFSLRAGVNIKDLVFSRVLIFILLVVLMLTFVTLYNSLVKESTIGFAADKLVDSTRKYKTKDYRGEGTYKDMDNKTAKSYYRPLIYDETNDVIYKKGDNRIKYSLGHHGKVGYENDNAWICMDATDKNYSDKDNYDAEMEFVNQIVSQETGNNNIKVIGKASSLFNSSSAAESASESVPDEDGIVCVTNIGA